SLIGNKISPARTRLWRSLFSRADPNINVRGVPLPPDGILFMDSTPQKGLRNGIAFAKLFAELGLNVETGTVLDVGCGWGRLAYGLLDQGFAGQYIGIDIIKPRIKWLVRHFSSRQPRYTFRFNDVKNSWYNPSGTKSRINFNELPKPDTIVLVSVFTHMYENDVATYLKDLSAIMSPGSSLVFTCFLFDGPAEEKIAKKQATRLFTHKLSDDCRYDCLSNPLAAIAYTETKIMGLLTSAGLTGRIIRGRWAGIKTPQNSPQDIVIARRAP